MISPFIPCVAKCSVVFHYSPLYFAVFISDITPAPARSSPGSRGGVGGWGGRSFQVCTPYIVYRFTVASAAFARPSGSEGRLTRGTNVCRPYAAILCQDQGDG